jgi:hypothetical protein
MTTPAEEQPLSRRQLRELQKSGGASSTAPREPATAPESTASESTDSVDSGFDDTGSNDTGRDDAGRDDTDIDAGTEDGPSGNAHTPTTDDDARPYAKVAPTDEVIETAEIVSPVAAAAPEGDPVVPVIPADGVPLTRRQARELERARTASITVIGADQGATPHETGEVVTAEPIEDATGEHAPVTEPEAELEVVQKGASETGDLTEAVVDVDRPDDETQAESDTVVADDFGEAALATDGDPLADEQPFDDIIATGIAEAEQTPTTSSTLIVGSPMTTFTGPIGGTGEIMVTGSIDLPRTLTGTADPGTGDRADYDRSLDHEAPAPPTAGTPVSASRAVSTHTSARDIIAPPARSKKPSIVPVLAIIAGVLMVAVLAVVVTSLLTGAL